MALECTDLDTRWSFPQDDSHGACQSARRIGNDMPFLHLCQFRSMRQPNGKRNLFAYRWTGELFLSQVHYRRYAEGQGHGWRLPCTIWSILSLNKSYPNSRRYRVDHLVRKRGSYMNLKNRSSSPARVSQNRSRTLRRQQASKTIILSIGLTIYLDDLRQCGKMNLTARQKRLRQNLSSGPSQITKKYTALSSPHPVR